MSEKNLDPKKRPEIEIIVPIQRETEQLEKTLGLLDQHTENFRLTIVKEPDLNVSEARQKAMAEIATGDIICFIDDDSEMCQPHWLDMMYRVLLEQKDAGAVFGGEWWGTDKSPTINPTETAPAHNHLYRLFNATVWPGGCEPYVEIEKGPAACMMIDRRRLPAELKWDQHIGLRSGWLGGDFEEVDYCNRMRHQHGLKLYRATRSLFHHTGGKTTMMDFARTHRFLTVNIMQMLLSYKYAKAPDDDDWFKGLKYVRARDDDDCFLAPGQTLREAYRDVIVKNGLSYVRKFQRLGLVD